MGEREREREREIIHSVRKSLLCQIAQTNQCTAECQRLKAKVVQQIRSNQQLEQDLGVMDIKIGLLVKNRLTLQDLALSLSAGAEKGQTS